MENHFKIAYICSSKSWGGLEMNHLKNAEVLSKRGHQVFVLGVDGSPFLKQAKKKNLQTIAIHHHHKYFHLRSAFKLSQILKKNEIDRIAVRDNRDLGLCATVRFYFYAAVRIFYFMEMQLTRDKKSFFHTRRYRHIEKWSCPLPYLQEQVVKHTRFPKEKTIVIPSGIHLSAFEQLPDQKEIRQQWGIKSEALVFGLIGRLDPQKGQWLLLEAFEKTAKEMPEAELLFMGDPTAGEGKEYANELKTKANTSPWKDRIHFLPFSPKILEFYSAVDVVVMASYAETFGMVTLEALAAQKPIIGSNAAGTPDLLEHGQAGQLFNSKNADDLAQQMLKYGEGKPTPHEIDLHQYDFEYIVARIEEVMV